MNRIVHSSSSDIQAKIDVVKITDISPSEQRNKPVISMTVRRAHYEDESKSPDWPGRNKVIIGRKGFSEHFQAPGLLRKTMQPNLQEDLFSEQQSATFTL